MIVFDTAKKEMLTIVPMIHTRNNADHAAIVFLPLPDLLTSSPPLCRQTIVKQS